MSSDTEEVDNPEIHFEPIVQLPSVDVKTLEEDEEELFKMRAKLFRYDSVADPPEWKERGTGDLKMLRKSGNSNIRILMRRDKTLKICANHYITTDMLLKPHSGSERAFVWNTLADFADEESKPELLAIRFANAENAEKFRSKFVEIQESFSKSAEKGDETKTSNPASPAATNGEPAGDAADTPAAAEAEKETPKAESPAKPDAETDKVVEQLETLTVEDQKSVTKD